MNTYFIIAALLAFIIGLAHSVLGERYILIRLFKRELPRLFGSDLFTKRTLRFAWHLTTAAWWGMAVIFVALALREVDNTSVIVVNIIAITFLVSAVVSLLGSRGRHFSWIVFILIAAAAWLGV
ncbi:MAG: hypothetical protein K8R79_07740 [Calditrichales bacterium]|nr:hypothetical protein [Calditrichales bacterium]